MKIAPFAFLVAALFCVRGDAQSTKEVASPPSDAETQESDRTDQRKEETAKTKGEEGDGEPALSPLVVLSEDKLNELLDRRTDGNAGLTFRDFTKIFLVQSRLNIGVGVGLIAEDKKISRSELQPAFLQSYQPTLRELLNSIALQTFSEWRYDREKQFVQTDQVQDEPVEGVVNIHFRRVKREKPFKVKLAEDWRSEDKGHWVMYIPPEFPVGMDIYEFGRYSTNEDDKNAFLEKIRDEVALEWAKRVKPKAEKEEMVSTKVGKYESLFFETLLKGKGRKVQWRQWVFMAGDRCFFIVSTIPLHLDDEIFPDVESMVQSFEMSK